jgi:hypothetical protein
MRTVRKAAFEEVIEGFDWSDRLDSDSLAASVWEVAAGLDASDATFDDSSTSVELSGGTATTQYLVTNKVTTTEGRAYQRSFKIIVVAR